MTYQIIANFAATLEGIGESKIFGLFPYIPSKFIRNVWGKVRKKLILTYFAHFWHTVGH